MQNYALNKKKQYLIINYYGTYIYVRILVHVYIKLYHQAACAHLFSVKCFCALSEL